MKLIALLLALFILTSFSHAMDPPEKMWERLYYQEWDSAKYYDIELTVSGNLFISGLVYDYTSPVLESYVALLANQDGDILWETPYVEHGGTCYDGDVLPDGSFIVTGRGSEPPGPTASLFIQKIDQNGSVEWTRVYDYPSTKEEGYSVTTLPDGGYAVCGRVNGEGPDLGKAWILRTDANGDTLWTDIQGTHTINFANGVEYDPVNDWIVVCMYGRTETLINKGPHLLYYSLDGEYLFGTTYPELYPEHARGFVPSADGGYAILSRVGTSSQWGTLTHTDALGEIQWSESVSALGYNDNLGLGFAQIDGGYLCCGYDGYSFWDSPDSVATDDPQTQDGSLTRFDAYGNELWHINNEMGHFNHFYSAVQLPQGGYIAAGTYTGSGYLVRYAPETGIEEGESSPSQSRLDLSPNPFSSSLSVSYSLPESMQTTLSVYDITGRMVGELEDGMLDAGEYTSTWDSGEFPSGCYVVMLRTERGVLSKYATLIK